MRLNDRLDPVGDAVSQVVAHLNQQPIPGGQCHLQIMPFGVARVGRVDPEPADRS